MLPATTKKPLAFAALLLLSLAAAKNAPGNAWLVDRPGADFERLALQNSSACVEACLRVSACQSWSFNLDALVCRLKSSAPPTVLSENTTSGTTTGPSDGP